MTVVETAEFLRKALQLMPDSVRTEIVAFVGANPEAGEIMPGTGGVRKLRWAVSGKGKSGGARVIYYYHNEQIPIFLLSMYAKSRKANLTKGEQNAMKKLVSALVAAYPRKG